MKCVKKFYLVPENRYKVFIENLSDPKSTPDLSVKSDKPNQVEGEKNQFGKEEDNAQNLLEKSDITPENKDLEENPSISPPISPKGSEGNRLPFEPIDSQQKGGKLSSPPPPGIPIKSKKKRLLPWISL
jgi:hypothetical protein